nr:MAG TPA: hypothetical protein [Caudoviricetes sp.]
MHDVKATQTGSLCGPVLGPDVGVLQISENLLKYSL